jgi:hypothetical protein
VDLRSTASVLDADGDGIRSRHGKEGEQKQRRELHDKRLSVAVIVQGILALVIDLDRKQTNCQPS